MLGVERGEMCVEAVECSILRILILPHCRRVYAGRVAAMVFELQTGEQMSVYLLASVATSSLCLIVQHLS